MKIDVFTPNYFDSQVSLQAPFNFGAYHLVPSVIFRNDDGTVENLNQWIPVEGCCY